MLKGLARGAVRAINQNKQPFDPLKVQGSQRVELRWRRHRVMRLIEEGEIIYSIISVEPKTGLSGAPWKRPLSGGGLQQLDDDDGYYF